MSSDGSERFVISRPSGDDMSSTAENDIYTKELITVTLYH